jgi:hypothetical protein
VKTYTSGRIVGLPGEIWNGKLSNTSEKSHLLIKFAPFENTKEICIPLRHSVNISQKIKSSLITNSSLLMFKK